jgi:DNA-binding NarL/FixJ family response regulator
MHAPSPRTEQATPVHLQPGLERIDPDNLKKITPAMLRVVEALALGDDKKVIAERENISLNSLNKRIDRLHKLLNVKSTISAYRLLLLAGLLLLR